MQYCGAMCGGSSGWEALGVQVNSVTSNDYMMTGDAEHFSNTRSSGSIHAAFSVFHLLMIPNLKVQKHIGDFSQKCMDKIFELMLVFGRWDRRCIVSFLRL